MNESQALKRAILDAIILAVPQWYFASEGPHPDRLRLAGEEIEFYRLAPFSILLENLKNYAQDHLKIWRSSIEQSPPPDIAEMVQDQLAQQWLHSIDSTVEWRRLLKYFHDLQVRTYENQLVSLNLLVSDGTGTIDVTDPEHQKLLDPLGISQQVYIRVDKKGRLLEYGEVPWHKIAESKDPKFNPEFLQPFSSVVSSNEYSMHQTTRGDLIIMDSRGLLASKRRRLWHFYDVVNLRNNISEMLGNSSVSANIFEVIFDLSYRRRGALLIYDPSGHVVQNVTNSYSRLGEENTALSNVHDALRKDIYPIAIGRRGLLKKRLLLEIAGMDGATIFNDRHITAFGAMIKSHDEVREHPGARSMAANSAFLFGGIPIKISADGDVTILFRSRADSESVGCEAKIDFL